jgi:hypothetical protein
MNKNKNIVVADSPPNAQEAEHGLAEVTKVNSYPDAQADDQATSPLSVAVRKTTNRKGDKSRGEFVAFLVDETHDYGRNIFPLGRRSSESAQEYPNIALIVTDYNRTRNGPYEQNYELTIS